MTAGIAPDELERFRAIIGRRLGLNVDESRMDSLASVLAKRIARSRGPGARYLDALEVSRHTDELRALAAELTVNETYFFRNPDQFRACAELVIPERLAARAAERRLNVLSAGCASGEEPYSLAILLREQLPDPSWQVSLRAFDLSPAMLAKAERARYSAWALRETSAAVQRRWFRNDGGEFVLHQAIREIPAFHESNLTEDDPRIWTPAQYDVVFCRNVIMYLTAEAAEQAVARIARSLARGGYLFLGHAETLRGLSLDFHLCHTHGTFYYRLKEASGAPENRPSPRPEPASPTIWNDTWLETIEHASLRIEALSKRSSEPQASGPEPPSPAEVRRDLGVALELLERERYEEALSLLGDVRADARDPDALLLHAVLLTHAGKLEAATAACASLLALDELNTGAHYVLALCCESAGDRQRAMNHDRMAVYLDPSFAMPRLHLGLMARRMDDRETARRELAQALMLLQREDAARLLLFGGGFNRDTLTALCRAELSAVGGTA